jgi:hypothetical protein
MMQRNRCATDLVHQRLAARLEFFEIGRPERRLGGSRKNEIRDFEIADRPIVRRGNRIDFFRNAL